MIAALNPLDGLVRGRDVFITDRKSGGRTGIVAESGAGDLHAGVFDALRHEYRVIIIQSGNVFNSPSTAEALLFLCPGKVAAPGDARFGNGHIRIKAGSPHGLKSTLASAFRHQIFAVPFRTALEIFHRTQNAEDHSVEKRGFRIRILLRVKRIAASVGFDAVKELFIVGVIPAEFLSMRINIETDPGTVAPVGSAVN